MENAQRELVRVLLEALCARGLVSKATGLRAADLIHAGVELPPFFQGGEVW